MLKVMGELPINAPVAGSLVWVQALVEDNPRAAKIAANQLAGPRLRHFYDPGLIAAREMAEVLGGTGRYAWDTYLVFSPEAEWVVTPPVPSDWVHQLDHSAWAPAGRRIKGQALLMALQRMVASDE